MGHTMSLTARRDMLVSIRQRYLAANRTEKTKILDGFVAAIGYDRKYATYLLRSKNKIAKKENNTVPEGKTRPRVYDDQFRYVLLKVWHTINQICSKRLVPFIPEFVSAMERYGNLRISEDLRTKLMNVSAATVDRIL